MNGRLLGIIPARGGSKGIPRKNLAILGGKPLIDHSIEVGLESLASGAIQHLIVSTDDPEIAGRARALGVDIPFMRPARLASDEAKSVDVVTHAFDALAKMEDLYTAAVLLQPTTPLRSARDVIEATALFRKHNAESLISAYRDDTLSPSIMYHVQGDYAKGLDSSHNRGLRRQDHEPIYVRNGAIYIVTRTFLQHGHSLISDKPLIYAMARERSINIDTLSDLELAEWQFGR